MTSLTVFGLDLDDRLVIEHGDTVYGIRPLDVHKYRRLAEHHPEAGPPGGPHMDESEWTEIYGQFVRQFRDPAPDRIEFCRDVQCDGWALAPSGYCFDCDAAISATEETPND